MEFQSPPAVFLDRLSALVFDNLFVILGLGLLIGLAIIVSLRKRRRRMDRGSVSGLSDFERLLGGKAPPSTGTEVQKDRLTAQCKWVRDAFRNDTQNIRWVCDSCGAETFVASGRRPDHCGRRSKRLSEAGIDR